MSEEHLNIDLEKERKEILNAFRGLLRTHKNRSREDTEMIRKAFDVAVDAHKEMRRKSGEPYITIQSPLHEFVQKKWDWGQLQSFVH